MKKQILLLFSAVALFVGSASAQVFDEGSLNANVGIGLGLTLGSGSSTLPPLSLAVDYGVTENIGVGGYLGYAGAKEEFNVFGTEYSWKYSYLVIGVRGTYHFIMEDDLDIYGGALLGYNVASAKFESDDESLESLVQEPSVGGVAYALFGGARYMFSEKVGVFGELGYGISWITAGLTMKL
ncbi:outer membrane beta-barrel protein [Halocola ammonii]